MDREPDSRQRILRILRLRPKGMTITEITKRVGMTRNSVSKHLHLLQVAGEVDVQAVGNAKMYSIAHRVPLSAFLCFTRNMILVLDSRLNIVQCNDSFLAFADIDKDDLLGQNIRDLPLPVVASPGAMAELEGLQGEQIVTEIPWHKGDTASFYEMQIIPTVFIDGEQGCTVILEDITEKKKYIHDMEFLARTAMEFVDLPTTASICELFAERLTELVPGALVCVLWFDPVHHEFVLRAVADVQFRDGGRRILGRDPVGMTFPVSGVPYAMLDPKAEEAQGLRELTNIWAMEEKECTFSGMCFSQIPFDIRRKIQSAFAIEKAYGMPFIWRHQFFGGMGLFLRSGHTLKNAEAVESFIRQASIAMSRKMTERLLIKSERRFREVVEYSPFPVALIDQHGRYIFINHAFTRIFGYSLDDIPTGRDWFRLAFPDEDERRHAIAIWKEDLAESSVGEIRPRTFSIRCKNGAYKNVMFLPVSLCDATQYITYQDMTDMRLAHRAILSELEKLQRKVRTP